MGWDGVGWDLAQLRARGADAADLPSDAHAMREPEAGNVYLRRLRYGIGCPCKAWHVACTTRGAQRVARAGRLRHRIRPICDR
jgi:hypothetical protein